MANPQTSSVFATFQLVDGSSAMDIPDREWIVQGTNKSPIMYPKTSTTKAIIHTTISTSIGAFLDLLKRLRVNKQVVSNGHFYEHRCQMIPISGEPYASRGQEGVQCGQGQPARGDTRKLGQICRFRIATRN